VAKKTLTDEQRQAMRERMAVARSKRHNGGRGPRGPRATRTRADPGAPQGRFSIDSAGNLDLFDVDLKHGLSLDVSGSRELYVFLHRYWRDAELLAPAVA
jgi:hypothetical protein